MRTCHHLHILITLHKHILKKQRHECAYKVCAKSTHPLCQLRLTVTGEREGVVSTPGGTTRGLVESVTLTKTTVLLAFSGETSGFTVLVDRVADPVDTSVSSDSLV